MNSIMNVSQKMAETQNPSNYTTLSKYPTESRSHYVLLNEFRMRWLPEDFEQAHSSGHASPFRKFILYSGSLHTV